jgi:hypothetical protein
LRSAVLERSINVSETPHDLTATIHWLPRAYHNILDRKLFKPIGFLTITSDSGQNWIFTIHSIFPYIFRVQSRLHSRPWSWTRCRLAVQTRSEWLFLVFPYWILWNFFSKQKLVSVLQTVVFRRIKIKEKAIENVVLRCSQW